MKNDCGHPVSSENSVLRCDDCEAAQRKREDDALWNSAIEAAAKKAEWARVLDTPPNGPEWGEGADDVCSRNIARHIRALKRETP